MSGYTVVENPSAELWNSFLGIFPEVNFEQCFEYGEISKMAYPRTRVARLSITHNGEPVGIVQGTYSSYFGFGMTLRVMRGPLVAAGIKENSQLVGSLLKGLEEYGKKKRIIHARILVPDSWQLQEVFHKLSYTSADRTNEYVVNLEEGTEKLWKSIDHNKRRNIRRAMKEGVEIVQSHDQKDLVTFYSMVEASVERRGFSPYPRSWFEAIWKTYKPELSKVFLAYWKGKSVSGVFIVVRGKTVYALGAGSLAEGWEVRPNDIMHWKVMEWAYQNGYSRYHMGLVDEPIPTEESSAWGIWRWKKEWKGSLEGVQAFDKVFLPKYKLILQAQKFVEHLL